MTKLLKISNFLLLLTCIACIRSSAQCPPPGGNQNGPFGAGGGRFPGAPGQSGSPFYEWPVLAVHAVDPNDILGPIGYDTTIKWISIRDRIEYRVRFENDPKLATAPAQNVFIHIPVHPRINASSLRLGGFGFGSYTFTVPDNQSHYTARLDCRDSLNVFVDVTAGIDVVKNEVFWIFRSIDPLTGQAPADALTGFLPVNDTAINRFNDTLPKPGEGYVSFRLVAKTDALTGDTVAEKATIVFDTNEEIPTNVWSNTIDALPPSSDINFATLATDTISLFWNSNDDNGGSGVKEHSLYYSENGGPYLLYKSKISGLSEKFIGTAGNTYCFFTLAFDNTGNPEPMKNSCDLSLRIPDGNIALPVNWLYFRGKRQDKDVVLNWATSSEINTEKYEIQRSLDASSFTRVGIVNAVGNATSVTRYDFTDQNAASLPSKKLYYRLKQIDNNGVFEYSKVIEIDLDVQEPHITVFPNPFNKVLTVMINNVTLAKPGDHLQLSSIDGKVVYKKGLGTWQNNVAIPLTDLPALKNGVYVMTIILDGKVSSVKLIRQ
ncbi:MAG: T9SS type A sorting domain-containing protein [Chitinophagaceae bacterium]